jgi:Methyltransferase domain
MRWEIKAAVQKAISYTPRSEELNYLLQTRVARSFPTSDQQIRLHFEEALRHAERFERHSALALCDARLYEFGAGWDLVGPLSLWSLGAEDQTLVDITAHLRWNLASHTLDRLSALHGEFEELAGRPLRRPPATRPTSTSELRSGFGIAYKAPCDARCTGLESQSFDLISSTFTLEHIPREDIAAILVEARRLLAPGGLISCSIDLQDHYAFADPRISIYNFLRFSQRTWDAVNCSLHFQNRLRARDHLALFVEAGLTPLATTEHRPDSDQRRSLDSMPIHRDFADHYNHDELEIYALDIAAVAR